MNYPEEKHSEPLLRNPYEPIAAIPGNPYLQSYPAVDEYVKYNPPPNQYVQPPQPYPQMGVPQYNFRPPPPPGYYQLPPPQYYPYQQQYYPPASYPPNPPQPYSQPMHRPINASGNTMNSSSQSKNPRTLNKNSDAHDSPTNCPHCGRTELKDTYSMSCVAWGWCFCLLTTGVLWLIPLCSKSCKNRKTYCTHCYTLVADKIARCC